MKMIYLGAEVGSNRTVLNETDADYYGFSYWRLKQRGLPTTKKYLIENYVPQNVNIFVHAGVPLSQQMTDAEYEDFAADYEEFIVDNIDRITMFAEFDHSMLSSAFIDMQRRTVWAELQPGKFLPVWNSATGLNGLKQLAESYLDIGLRGVDIEGYTNLRALTTTLRNKHETRFHAIGCADPAALKQVRVDTASSLAWLSPMMRGETIVWDNNRIARYPAKMKEQARPRYKNLIAKAGLDYEKILADDIQEVSKLAVWSYNQLEQRMNMGNLGEELPESYILRAENEEGKKTEETPAVYDNKGIEERNFSGRNPEEMVALPVFGYDLQTITDPDGVIREVPVVQTNQAPMLQCNSCFLSATCPAFKQNNSCAYSIPIEVKTKEQLKGLINTVIEMQGQRVAFMRFAEQMNGGYADPNVSQEIDRLFKLIKTTKELDDSREFIRMTVERQGGAGVLSSIFGDKAQALRELPQEIPSETIIKQINPE
jgi:hypothetical protein